jgi:hypothetical protein
MGPSQKDIDASYPWGSNPQIKQAKKERRRVQIDLASNQTTAARRVEVQGTRKGRINQVSVRNKQIMCVREPMFNPV